jgi:enoyl-CoA hydratase/carnithine racemase
MSDPSIHVVRDGAIATVTLNRPERLNALDKGMWGRLAAVFEGLSAEEELRCVVLRGAGGKAFAAGADIAEFGRERADSAQGAAYGRLIDAAMRAVGECRHPTVALIQGACVGGGLELAAMCDLRICGESSRFGVPVTRLGLVMGYGELRGLIALVGRATTLEILLEGRVFDAGEALDKGLVTRVVPDDEAESEACATARRIAEGAPLVARWHKKFARRLADPTPLAPEEIAEAFACFDTDDFREGVRAFLAREKPAFRGR